MSVAISAPPGHFRVHRAPLLDPPFDDELGPDIYQPLPYRPSQAVLPPEALAGASPACQTAALRFLNVCLELFNGFRSQRQMWPLLHVEHAIPVLDELARVLRYANDLRKRLSGGRVRRSGLRICEPRPGVAEVAAVLNDGSRAWAMCYRLEHHADTWRCTYLKVALPPADAPHRRPPPQRTKR